jgi:hypothetical protein
MKGQTVGDQADLPHFDEQLAIDRRLKEKMLPGYIPARGSPHGS